jgi:hypothetical protein
MEDTVWRSVIMNYTPASELGFLGFFDLDLTGSTFCDNNDNRLAS